MLTGYIRGLYVNVDEMNVMLISESRLDWEQLIVPSDTANT